MAKKTKRPVEENDDEMVELDEQDGDESSEPVEIEGTRAFSVFLNGLGDGDCHAELSEELRKLMAKMRTQAVSTKTKCKGKLSLTLVIEMEPKGFATATHSVSVVEPKQKRGGGIFWVTKAGNATFENPRQTKLPFTEIKGGGGKAKEAPARGNVTEA